jgi:hypothetical protein
MAMEIIVKPGGIANCIYSDDLPLAGMGNLTITRASHVEPTVDGKWMADLSPVDGPTLGPFEQRSEALAAEVEWLRANWLKDPSIP